MSVDLLPALGRLALGGPASPSPAAASPPCAAAAAAAAAVAPPTSPPPPPPPTSPTPTPGALPFTEAFYPLLSTKILDGVDVCTLGCVNKELSSCVRAFWKEAETSPGSQARMLRADDHGPGVEAAAFHSSFHVYPPKTRVQAEMVTGEKLLVGYGSVRVPAGWWLNCSSCGRSPSGTQALTFPYLFDGRQRYGDFESRFENTVARQRGHGPKSPFMFEHDEPHACVRRVAAFELSLHTPKELHEHWASKGLEGWA